MSSWRSYWHWGLSKSYLSRLLAFAYFSGTSANVLGGWICCSCYSGINLSDWLVRRCRYGTINCHLFDLTYYSK